MHRLAPRNGVCYLLLLVCFSPWILAASAVADVEARFSYISNALQTFRATGRLLNNPGIDDSDLKRFVVQHDESYLIVSRDF